MVKELIYLDALQSMYVSKKSLLNDDDYDELKDSLTWDGSALVTMSGNGKLCHVCVLRHTVRVLALVAWFLI